MELHGEKLLLNSQAGTREMAPRVNWLPGNCEARSLLSRTHLKKPGAVVTGSPGTGEMDRHTVGRFQDSERLHLKEARRTAPDDCSLAVLYGHSMAGVLVRVSIASMKHHDQKQLGEKRIS